VIQRIPARTASWNGERLPISDRDLLQELLTLGRTGVAVFDRDHRVRWAAEPLPWIAVDEALGQRCDTLFRECDPSCHPCLLERARDEGSFRCVLRAPGFDGRAARYFETSVGPLPDGGEGAAWIALFREIDEPAGFGVLLQAGSFDIVRLIDGWSVPVVLLGPDGTIRAWNHGARRLYGYSRDEALGRPWEALIGEVDRKELAHPPETKTRRYEARQWNALGKPLDVVATHTELEGPRGEPQGSFLLIADQTQSKNLERTLARRVAQLSVLREIADCLQRQMELDAILRTVLVGVTAGEGLGFNRAFLLLVDERRGALRGREGVGPADPEEAHRIWTELAGRTGGLGELLREIEPILYRQNSGVSRLARSISVRLDDPDRFLVRVLAGNAPVVVRDGKTSPGGEPVEAAILETLGVRSFAAAPLHGKGRAVGLLLADNAITGREIEEDDVEVLELLATQVAFAIERAHATEAIATQVESLEEATRELRDHEIRLVRAERLSAIGEMAARVVHEIRNPLAAIGGFARSLIRDDATERERREAAEIIVDEVRRLEDIIREVLDFARPAPPRRSAIALDRLASEAVELLRFEIEESGAAVAIDVPVVLPRVSADRDQLFQALVNVLRNALHAMPQRGRIDVRFRTLPGAVEIAIADTGVGMSPEVRAKIFEPFFTTKSSGTGLGLTIAAQILRDHDGEIAVESRQGEGTTVFLRIPIESEDTDHGEGTGN
jgi:PAS domain S-box-containing protein